MQGVADKLAATTAALRRAGATVWIMKVVPSQPVWVPMGMAKALLNGRSIDIGVTKQKYQASSRLEDEFLAPAAESGAIILDPAPYFFQHQETCMVESGGDPIYADDNHINSCGASLLGELFRPIFSK